MSDRLHKKLSISGNTPASPHPKRNTIGSAINRTFSNTMNRNTTATQQTTRNQIFAKERVHPQPHPTATKKARIADHSSTFDRTTNLDIQYWVVRLHEASCSWLQYEAWCDPCHNPQTFFDCNALVAQDSQTNHHDAFVDTLLRRLGIQRYQQRGQQ